VGILNCIEVSCWDLNKPVQELGTDKQNRIVIDRDVLPIIFIPGIMGSRLGTSQGDKVWDPDDKWFMSINYGRSKTDAEWKKSLVIGTIFLEDYLNVLNDDLAHNLRFADFIDDTRAFRKWGGVSWNSYGSFLTKLQTRDWDSTVNLFFEFPIHCFGYNWTASNGLSGELLASYIEEVIKTYTDQQRNCQQVILVTHSMGGLVARAACKLSGAEAKVLATIHGVQPTNGSPAAYWRMKGGFERPHDLPELEPMQWLRNPAKASGFLVDKAVHGVTGHITSWVLGTDGEEVTALLGNMPGALQLLPNSRYRDNSGSRGWLELVDATGKTVTLPVANPYEEIYRKQGVYYRLIKPEWLNPSSKEFTSAFKKSQWNLYLSYLQEAEDFHDSLFDKNQAEIYCHPETYQFHSTGIASADRVVFARSEDSLWESARRILSSVTEGVPKDLDGVGNALVFTAAGLGLPLAKKLVDVALNMAGGAVIKDNDWYANRGGYRDRVDAADLPEKEGQVNLVTMLPPSGCGDGTVPESSGRALQLQEEDVKRTFSIGESSDWEENPANGKAKQQADFAEGFFERSHEPIFNTASAQFITIAAIENICRKEIKRRLEMTDPTG